MSHPAEKRAVRLLSTDGLVRWTGSMHPVESSRSFLPPVRPVPFRKFLRATPLNINYITGNKATLSGALFEFTHVRSALQYRSLLRPSAARLHHHSLPCAMADPIQEPEYQRAQDDTAEDSSENLAVHLIFW
jgi:hypothetical protein